MLMPLRILNEGSKNISGIVIVEQRVWNVGVARLNGIFSVVHWPCTFLNLLVWKFHTQWDKVYFGKKILFFLFLIQLSLYRNFNSFKSRLVKLRIMLKRIGFIYLLVEEADDIIFRVIKFLSQNLCYITNVCIFSVPFLSK